jgi:hypothetical protein
MFNYCVSITALGKSTPWGSREFQLMPMGSTGTIPEAGALSLWFKFDRGALTQFIQRLEFRIKDANYSVGVYNDYQYAECPYAFIKLAGVQESSPQIVEPTTWSHMYIVWDKNANLYDNRTLRFFLNGTEVAYSSTAILQGVPTLVGTVSAGYSLGGDIKLFVDNIKMWSHVPTEDPEFEYNSGTGREGAIHAIYASANDYAPALTGTNNGVGYFQAAYAQNDVRITI